MRKLILVFVMFLAVPCAYAADVGTITERVEDLPNGGAKMVTLDCTASAGDIVYTLQKYSGLIGKKLRQVEILPLVAPTAASDLYIYNFGGDVTDSELVDKVTTTGTTTILTYQPVITGAWTIDVDNNAVASARILIKLIFY